MAITSASTLAEIVGQYLDNCSYDMNGSASQCAAFIVACRALKGMQPSDWQHKQQRITFQPKVWEEELQSAKAWYAANGPRGAQANVLHADLRDFRN